jgi:hypothetical protein
MYQSRCIVKYTYIHSTHAFTQRYLRYSSETPTFYQNELAVKNTADVTGGKAIAVLLQCISGIQVYPVYKYKEQLFK